MLGAAMERVLEVCGEALSNLYRVAPAVAETIPHGRDIIGFRNSLAHGYAEMPEIEYTLPRYRNSCRPACFLTNA
jgi:uncharacterized protein with HEPN domain